MPWQLVDGTQKEIDPYRKQQQLVDGDGNRVWRTFKKGSRDGKPYWEKDGEDVAIRPWTGEAWRRNAVAIGSAGTSLPMVIPGLVGDIGNYLMTRGAERLGNVPSIFTGETLNPSHDDPNSVWSNPILSNPVSRGIYNTFNAGRALNEGLVGTGYDLWQRIKGEGGGESALSLLSNDQIRAAKQAGWDEADDAGKKSIMNAILGMADGGEKGVGFKPGGMKTTEANKWDDQDTEEGKNPLRWLSPTNREAATSAYLWEKLGGKGDVSHLTQSQRNALAVASIVPWLVGSMRGGGFAKGPGGMGRGKSFAGRVAGSTATATGAAWAGPTVGDAMVRATGGEVSKRNPEQDVAYSEMWGGIGGALIPAAISAIVKGTVRGGSSWVNRGKKKVGDILDAEEAAGAFDDFSNKDVVEAYSWLARNKKALGIKVPGLSEAENMGESGRKALQALLHQYPNLSKRVKEVLGGKEDELRESLGQVGANQQLADNTIRTATQGDMVRSVPADLSQRFGGSVRETVKNTMTDVGNKLFARYDEIKNSETFRNPLFNQELDARKLGKQVDEFKKSIVASFANEKPSEEIKDYIRQTIGGINRSSSAGDLLKLRNEIREFRRSYKRNSSTDVAYGNTQRGLGKLDERLTQLLHKRVGDDGMAALRATDQDYRTTFAEPLKSLDDIVTNQNKVLKDQDNSGFVKSLVSDNGRINSNNYMLYKQILSRGGKAGQKAQERIDKLIANRIAEGIKTGNNEGQKIMDIIHDNWAFLGSNNGPAVFEKIGQALGGRLARAAKRSGNPSIKDLSSSTFLRHLADPNSQKRVRALFANSFGGYEAGDNIIRWVFTQHLMNARSPKNFFRGNKEVMRGFYNEEQLTAMQHLSVAYENSQRFKVAGLLSGKDAISPQLSKGFVGKMERYAMENLGNSLGSLLSTMRLWAVRQQGTPFVTAVAIGRIFRAKNTREIIDVLLSEAGRNKKVAQAMNYADFSILSQDEMRTLVRRLGMTYLGVGGDNTEQEQKAEDIGRRSVGGSVSDKSAARLIESAGKMME